MDVQVLFEQMKLIIGLGAGLIMILLGTYIGLTISVNSRLATLKGKIDENFQAVGQRVAKEMGEMKLLLATEYVHIGRCSELEEINRNAHEDLRKDQRHVERDVAEIKGRMEGADG